MPLGMEIGFGPGHFMITGDLALPRKGHSSPPPLFGPSHIVLDGDPVPETGTAAPTFGPISIVAKR